MCNHETSPDNPTFINKTRIKSTLTFLFGKISSACGSYLSQHHGYGPSSGLIEYAYAGYLHCIPYSVYILVEGWIDLYKTILLPSAKNTIIYRTDLCQTKLMAIIKRKGKRNSQHFLLHFNSQFHVIKTGFWKKTNFLLQV